MGRPKVEIRWKVISRVIVAVARATAMGERAIIESNGILRRYTSE